MQGQTYISHCQKVKIFERSSSHIAFLPVGGKEASEVYQRHSLILKRHVVLGKRGLTKCSEGASKTRRKAARRPKNVNSFGRKALAPIDMHETKYHVGRGIENDSMNQ
jgi:hypothetical protein